VTYDTPLQGKIFTVSARLSKDLRSYVEKNLKSLAQAVLNDMFDCMPKIVGFTWPVTRTLWRKLLMHPVGIPYVKLRAKFEVFSSNSFEDILDRLPENLGVTWPKPRPFRGNYLCASSAFPRRSYAPNLKSLAQVVLKILWIVCKNFRGHVT